MSSRLIELIAHLPGRRVLLVGDFMLDRYMFGSTGRISPEAPIPVLRLRKQEHRPGGAGFVLAGLITLGAQVQAIGVCGDDTAGKDLRDALQQLGADCRGMIPCPGRPTVEKIRLLGSSEDRAHQQMIRLDIEDSQPIDDAIASRILAAAREAIGQCDVVALEDYNKGVLTPAVCQSLIALAREHGKPVLVDPARLNDYSKYRGATAIKLNRPETEAATGLKIQSEADYAAAADKLLAALDLEALVLTLNDKGSYLATKGGTRELLAGRSRQVADATGAGDMVLVTLSLAHASGASWHEAVALANVAGGLEVEKLGCVPIAAQELVADILAESHSSAGKERSLESLLPELARHRLAGRRIVFTNGCFDIIHLGHVKYFQFSKAQGDILVVGVNTDASIQRLKGPKRPVVDEDDRIGVLEELESIDYLIKFDSDTPIDLIRAVEPDVLVKGADYAKEQVVGWDLVEARGGHVALAPLITGRSTSSVISKIIDAYGK